ncbi:MULTISPECIES: hypothetical protein [Chromohalobacter]|nr:hypothetical protein [Chromohalobacter canadensis]
MQPHLIVTDRDNTLLNAEHDFDDATLDVTFDAWMVRQNETW